MSNDLFKGVNFTPGQEVRSADLTNITKYMTARLNDQVLDMLTPGSLLASGNPDLEPASDTKWAYALSAGGASPVIGGTGTDKKVRISKGTLFQKLGATTGDEAELLSYTFDGTDEVTLANGHATLQRVDLIQMKLEWESGDSESRVFAQEAVEASLDTGPLATTMDTVYRAKNRGLGGNSIQIRTVSGGSPSYVEAGNLITLTFVTGVTTVAAMEALVTANSTLIEVQTADPTPATVLSSPGDVFGYTSLTGGVDQLLLSQSMNIERRVKLTMSVLSGTPGAAPVVMHSPTSGYVPIAAVIVHPLFVAGDSFSYDDELAATETATIMDLRMPINVKRHVVHARECIFDEADWKLREGRSYISPLANEYNSFQMPLRTGLTRVTGDSLSDPLLLGIPWDLSGGSSPYIHSNALGRVDVDLPLKPGMTLTEAAWHFYGDGSADVTMSVFVANAGVVVATLNVNLQSHPAASWSGASFDLTNYETQFGDILYVSILASASGIRVSDVAIHWVPTSEAGPTTSLIVPCPGVLGRIVGLTITSENAGDPLTDTPETLGYISSYDGINTPVDLVKVGGFVDDLFADTTVSYIHGGLDFLEDPDQCQAVAAKGGSDFGMPLWTNGRRAPVPRAASVTAGSGKFLVLRVSKHDNPDRVRFYKAVFYIAEGI